MPRTVLFFRTLISTALISLVSLTGCSSEADTAVISDKVSADKIAEIKANINKLHPDIDSDLQAQVLDTAVRAIENMVYVEGGRFIMGDFGMPCDADYERPVWRDTDDMCDASSKADTSPGHPVELDSYSISKYETRVKDMDSFFGSHGQDLTGGDYRIDQPDHEAFRPDLPAGTRSWQDAKDYCTWLGKVTGLAFDLPTEAQWEYAARSRGQNVYYATDNGFLENGRNTRPYDKDSGKLGQTYPVDMLPPNPLGIYGMQYNAAEWVNDWYDPDYYSYSPIKNPPGPEGAVELVSDGDEVQVYRLMRGNLTGEINNDILIRREISVQGLAKYNSYHSRYGFRCSIQSDKNPF